MGASLSALAKSIYYVIDQSLAVIYALRKESKIKFVIKDNSYLWYVCTKGFVYCCHHYSPLGGCLIVSGVSRISLMVGGFWAKV